MHVNKEWRLGETCLNISLEHLGEQKYTFWFDQKTIPLNAQEECHTQLMSVSNSDTVNCPVMPMQKLSENE